MSIACYGGLESVMHMARCFSCAETCAVYGVFVLSGLLLIVQEGNADSLQLERGTEEEGRADFVAKQLG